MPSWPEHIDISHYIQAGDTISWSHAGAEPTTLIRQFLEQRYKFGGTVSVFLSGVSFSNILTPEHADVIRFKGIGGLTAPRALAKAGKLETLPKRYFDFPNLIRERLLPIDVQFVTVSPPDADGFVSLGVTVGLTNDILAQARVAIAEINPNMPRIAGDTVVHIDRFTAAIWSDRSLITGPATVEDPSPAVQQICRNIASLIGDGATVQIGIGSIGVTLPRMLRERRNIGIHSAILTDGLMELIETGAADGRAKRIDVGVAVAGELIGSERLYRFADRNAGVALRGASYVLSPDTFGRLDRLVSVNSALEVDLSGQVNAETLGGVNVGAIGGQVDFVRGASRSPGGASVIALQAVAGNGKSRIVSRLSDGVITTPRSEVGYIVTEFGIADLRGKTVDERAHALAAIAHPDHRSDLMRNRGAA
jgi:acetyl-CoA hydrolase